MIIQYVQLDVDPAVENALASAVDRKPAYAALDGLMQKYYCLDQDSGALVGVYLFRDQSAYEDYLASPLANAIPVADRRVLRVAFTLRDPDPPSEESP